MGSGGSKTVNETDSFTKSVVDSMVTTIQNCSNGVVGTQRINIIGNNNVVKGVKMVQTLDISISCATSDDTVMAMQQAVESQIRQKAETQNVAGLGAFSKSESENRIKLHNEVVTNISKETIQNIVNDFKLAQEFYLRGDNNIVEDVTMEQTMKVVFDGCLKAVSKISAVQEIKNSIAQEGKATQTNPISEIIGAIGNIMTSFGSMGVIIAVVAMCVGGYVIVKSGGLGAFLGTGGMDSQLAAIQAQVQSARAARGR